MVKEDFNKRLKRIKERSKITPRSRFKFIVVVVIAIIVMVLLPLIAYNIYQIETAKRAEKLEEAKKVAIENIKKIFSQYPHDPQLHIYLAKIESSNSIEEINRIIEEARRYIELRKTKEEAKGVIEKIFKDYNYTRDPQLHIYLAKIESSTSKEDIKKIVEEAKRYVELSKYKEEKIKYIKELYGKYYFESLYAQSIVRKIQEAKSKEEIDNILRKSNIEENAKMYYLIDIGNKIDPNKNYIVYFFGEGEEWKGSKILDYIKKLSLADLKNLSQKPNIIVPAIYSKVAIVVPATHCGNIPLEGREIWIYDKNNATKPIKGRILSSYLLVDKIEYTERIDASYVHKDDDEISILESNSNIRYSLENIPGIIYATAAEKLDYYKVMKKFGRYGEKFNKITSDTQIFDKDAKYLLIVSVPAEFVSKLVAIESDNLYVTVKE
ncbi:DUF515 domain-containing protein [Methanothermococcus sp. SCGC AD-155-E23]|nr:DUF515 domain-containing protein [Methanothermococcus sp. SCGC AD-155-E23]